MSVDLIGSTAFKQRKEDGGVDDWLDAFEDFYLRFKEAYGTGIDYHKVFVDDQNDTPDLELWKMLGDEILLSVRLKSFLQALMCVAALRDIVWELDQDLKKIKLGMKASAWIAEFPVTNLMFEFDGHTDFVGPAIDTGFRVAASANRNKLAISVDLALLLLSIENSSPALRLKLGFDGTAPLKGVLGESPYPVVWIDIGHDMFAREREAANGHHADVGNLKLYLQSFVKDADGWLFEPFIVDDGTRTTLAGSPLEDYYAKVDRVKVGIDNRRSARAPRASDPGAVDDSERKAEIVQAVKDFQESLKADDAPDSEAGS
jgi:hypothetical protein